jgi:geranylgeranyl reductase family protein
VAQDPVTAQDPVPAQGPVTAQWDVIVVGGGPAGLAAAHAAATAGARTLVLEKAEHPRYKTCGGGLIGTSLAAAPDGLAVPVRERVDRVTFSLDGRRPFTLASTGGDLVQMVNRTEFDTALADAARAAGAEVRCRTTVRGVEETGAVTLASGERLTAAIVVGADGSSGVTSRYVGVRYDQIDLGLELELPVSATTYEPWRGRLLIDWGPVPGSYGWVFPKGDRLTVGVIAARGQGEATKAYLRSFVRALGLAGVSPEHDSGHLTRCRAEDSPVHRGRVLVAGDAAGLLEPWTREGISFALRSGALAGTAAAAGDPASYVAAVEGSLVPAMRAGRRLLAAFSRHPRLFHRLLNTPPGWRLFEGFARGRYGFESVVERTPVRAALALLG